MRKRIAIFVIALMMLLSSVPLSAGFPGGGEALAVQSASTVYAADERLTNPLIHPLATGAADPWVIFKDGFYYYCRSLNDNSIGVAKAERLQDIGTAPMVTVFSPTNTSYNREVWAPELHYLQGRWYIYYAADNGANANHRMCVAVSDNPQGPYSYATGTGTSAGVLSLPDNRWAIDGTVLEMDNGDLYFIWSGWEGTVNVAQHTYIARMTNPYTATGSRAMISTPELPWEINGTPLINEGAQVLKKNGKVFIVQSASGSWLNEYCLGMLELVGTDPMNPAHWKKYQQPVFQMDPTSQAYSTGHASFTVSPDGTEDWIVYHSYKNYDGGWGNRSVRAQKFTWNDDGTPNFGTPVPYGTAIEAPSGTPAGLGMASFSDRFRTNAIADDFNTYQGTWTLNQTTGVASVAAGAAGGKIVSKTADFLDFEYEADVTLSRNNSNDNAGLIFRVNAPSNGADALYGYYAGISANNGGFLQVGRFINNWTELCNIPIPISLNTAYKIKVVAQGKFIEVYLNGAKIASVVDDTFVRGSIGFRTYNASASLANISVKSLSGFKNPRFDWSWAKGAIFVPTNAVNQIQHWQEYDHDINDRELYYAGVYGINLVRVYLHNLLWEWNPTQFLANIEDFLTSADKYGIKVEFVLFDDCWNASPQLGNQGAPTWGVHNSRWVQGPGNTYKDNYNSSNGNNVYRQRIRDYVKGVVGAFANDPRIAIWNTFNEPGNGQNATRAGVTKQIMNDCRIWIDEVGSGIPITATAGSFSGLFFSDFITWHPYEASYPINGVAGLSKEQLVDETMNRGRDGSNMTMTGIMDNYFKKGLGFAVWEFGIGRDNTRFAWEYVPPAEPEFPFHGLVYPDGHPWSVADIGALSEEAQELPLYKVEYYNGNFQTLVKQSVTPLIDFDLGSERGTASPDASARVNESDFSIRWTGGVIPKAGGDYTFYMDSDNIASVTIGGVKIIDNTTSARAEVSAVVPLEAGQAYDVKVEYYNANKNASVHFKWSGPGLAKQAVIPEALSMGADSVSVSPSILELELALSSPLKATVLPFGGSVRWESMNTSVATVDAEGYVRATGVGTAIIKATAVNGVSSQAIVVVKASGSPLNDPPAGYSYDHFLGTVLDPAWTIINERTGTQGTWNLTSGDSILRIVGRSGDMHQTTNAHNNVFVRPAPEGDFSIITKVAANVTANYAQGGPIIWQDQDNYIRFGHVYAGAKNIEMGLEVNAAYTNVSHINTSQHPSYVTGSNTVYLRLSKRGNVYSAEIWNNSLSRWITACRPVTANFTNLRVGVYAMGTGTSGTGLVNFDFDYFAWKTENETKIIVPSVPGVEITLESMSGGGYYNPEFKVADLGANPGTVRLIVAGYNSAGKMVEIDMRDEAIINGGSVTVKASVPLNEALDYKFFIWDENYVPLATITSFSWQ